MLTLTLRNMERDGLVTRTVTPSIPPRFDYELTDVGRSLAGPVKILGDWASIISDGSLRRRPPLMRGSLTIEAAAAPGKWRALHADKDTGSRRFFDYAFSAAVLLSQTPTKVATHPLIDSLPIILKYDLGHICPGKDGTAL